MNGPPPAPPEVPAWRLVATLALAGLVAGALLVFVYQATAPAIAAYKAEQLKLAVEEVLQGPASYDTLYLVDGRLVKDLPAGVDGGKLDTIWRGYDTEGKPVGYALVNREAGFQDFIRVIFGYDRTTNRLLAMKVLDSKETPGLGDKIELDPDFVKQFREGVEYELVGVKKGEARKDNPHDVETITGATISSKAVIRIINNALAAWLPLIEAYEG